MAKKQKTQQEDEDLVMTIASDEELSNAEDSSDSENSEDEAATQQQQEQINEDFEFDEGGAFHSSGGSSWDFTAAISRIEKMESGIPTATKRTSIQAKIDKRRKEKEDEKNSKKKKVKKEKKQEESDSEEDSVDEKGEEASEAEDENSDDEKEESDSSESSKDGNEQVDEEEDVVVEEERLQSALKDSKKDQQTREGLVDEMEKKKAAEFFETDPFAAQEFAKTKFETFADLKLSRPIMRAISHIGFEKPTPIQLRAIPIALTGKDICASAQTGSGKTAAFLLPILERLQFRSRRVQSTRVMIICPVRELATQCQSMLEQLARFTDITCSLAVGGLPLKAQEAELRNRPDVVVCTPGRMIDHLRNSKSVHMDDLEILVLDEADRLLELGFTEEVLELVRMCPVQRQTMLFSATMTSKVDQLIDLSMKRPVRISTDPLFDMAKHLVQEFVRIRPNREDDREAILLALCTRTFRSNTIVFMETKSHAHRMMIIFGLAGIKAAELHGNLQQRDRLEALQKFRDGTVDILLCTDIAARGIDVRGVHAVINYEMPKDITTYVHRVGRTARAGRNGRAVTLTSESRRLVMKQVSRHCQGFVKSRAVPDPVVAQWKARIESMQEDVNLVMHEETLEKRMREAEKEATRATNLLKHRDEINARPARTWFMSEKEKKNVNERADEDRRAKEEAAKEEAQSADPMSRAKKLKLMSHKKRRLFEIREREERMLADAAQDEEEDTGKKGKKGPVFTSMHVAGAAKHAKKAQQETTRSREEESIAEMHERKRLKREKARATRSSHGSGAFDVDMTSDGAPAPKPRKQRDANAGNNPFEFKEKITDYKKHAKKGSSSFKSKAKYKRRK
ncbi:DEAD-box ATP-dependent RNA helicase 28 [Phytophthora idaei]|nr:DEAD-box ATP-dependent RNA helicase 28 [Phytophthora idaei]KAG3162073.1 DEAD-box ATP-dependent RNA helicase 28 [Phytophthora idaei]KAG3252549.1 DEAD-box ATP-dependent RNA helicase 28 [Phytophthora idaei]